MSVIALLPMKAHSERVPGKNFRTFAGKPLFRWILDSLLALDVIDRIVINTDAVAILSDLGVVGTGRILIRERKPELCGDEVSMNRILEDDLAATDGSTYLMTHTTNPLISSDTLDQALRAYEDGITSGYDSLFTVNRHQTRFYSESGKPINHDPNNLIPTQCLEPWFEENSCIYVFSKESFQITRARVGSRPVLFNTPRLESVDIDNETEWHQAEIMALSRLVFQSHSYHGSK